MPYDEPSVLVAMHGAVKAMRQAREIVTIYRDALERIAAETSDPRAGAHADTAIKAADVIMRKGGGEPAP